MVQFTPVSGLLKIDSLVVPKLSKKPIATLTIRLIFSEPMDPNDPRGSEPTTAVISGIPLPHGADWRQIEQSTLIIPDLCDKSLIESAIYYCGYHNPIDILSLSFGKLKKSMMRIVIKGAIDFTFEGLSDLGKPTIEWHIDIDCSQELS